MKKALLLACVVFTLTQCLNAASVSWHSVTWSSGIVTLPGGNTAKTGDVIGYAAIINLWDAYNNLIATNAKELYQYVHDTGSMKPVTGSYTKVATSDSSGVVNIGGTLQGDSIINEMAVIIYTCEYDGYEYYLKAYGRHIDTDYPQIHENSNMAVGKTWAQGYAIPEPTSAILMLLGIAATALRRRSL